MDIKEDSRNSRRQAFETRLKALDDKMRKSQGNDEATFKMFKDQLVKLQEALNSQKVARELLEEKKGKELKMLNTNIN